jgi:Sap, sulfolipid-1-addressing protein
MWGTVLLLALVATADPVRNGTAALLCSRPRPMLNLLAFWFGGIAVMLLVGLGSLFMLRDFALTAIQHLASAAATSTVRHIQIAAGVVALLVALRIFVRERARLADCVSSVVGQQPSAVGPLSWLSTRARNTLEGGSLWVAFAAGLGAATPVEYLVALVAILSSAAATGAQVSAVVVYTVVAFAVAEIPLVGHLAAPARTREVMHRLHIWLQARRRQTVAVIVAVAGVLLVTTGMGSF